MKRDLWQSRICLSWRLLLPAGLFCAVGIMYAGERLGVWQVLPAADDLDNTESKLIVGQAAASSFVPEPGSGDALQVGVMPAYTALPPVVREVEASPTDPLYSLTFCSDERGEPGDLTQEGAVTLAATVTGTLREWGTVDFDYQWYKDDAALNEGGHIVGSDTDTLTVDPIWMDDAGQYWLVAENAFGKSRASDATEIVVHRALEILEDPHPTAAYIDDINNIDDTAVLHVEAVGSPGMTYQWYVVRTPGAPEEPLADSDNISGSTASTLEVSDVELADCTDYFGEYFVRVTDLLPDGCGANAPEIDSAHVPLLLILDVDNDALPGGNGSPTEPLDTIQAALEQFEFCFTGGMVRVAPGEYSSPGDIVIPPNVWLIGAGADEATGSTIRGGGVGVYPVVEAGGDDIEFSGFRVLSDSGDSIGFRMNGFNNLTVRNCVFAPGSGQSTGHFVGVWMDLGGTNKRVINNTIYGGQRAGVRFGFAAEVTIANNIVAKNVRGIQYDGGTPHNASIRNNDVYLNGPCFFPDCDYVGLDSELGENGNISDPPFFLDEEAGDFHLTDVSGPLLDAGRNESAVVFSGVAVVDAGEEIRVDDASRYFAGDEVEVANDGVLRTIAVVDRIHGILSLESDDWLIVLPQDPVELKSYGQGDMDADDRIIHYSALNQVDVGADEVVP